MRGFSNWLAFLIWTLVFVFPVQAEVSYSQVKESLEGRHWDPPKSYATLGEEEIPHLLSIIQDDYLPNYYRFRALRVLEHYPTPEVSTFLESLLQPTAPPLLLRHGLEAYASAFSADQPKAVRDLAWQFHDHPDPELRLTVARAIRTISPDEFDLLIQQEPKDWVRQAALQ
jgi:hypothetical protein